ncbi:MAG TPA: glutamine synthetase family protein [Candidatus Deferrimicrobium sp.]|nr:glutamine synthetase family protein [Candidatus Deferrimicrobium sp.]
MIELNDPKRGEIVDRVIKYIQKENIKYARLMFTDINGLLKSFSVSTKYIETTLANGQYFDGSSITGMGRIEESDMVAVPDPSTFAVIPWRAKDLSTCRFICDIYLPNQKPYEGDPRFVLKRAMEAAQKEGFIYKCAPELEFFILEENESTVPTPMDFSGYFDLHPSGISEDLRRKMADTAEQFGIDIEVAHHEVAVGQNEIDFRYDEVMTTADRTVTMKMLIKSIAKLNGYLATFMPKPFFGVNGSGMHVHQSLWTLNGENAFYADNEDSGYLSEIALYFIGGQLSYGREMSAILASWPNSYKRLVPGYEAPVYVAYAHKNRSALIRVPDFGKRKNAARMEIRCPDPAGNPYLQFAVLLYIGLNGIKKKIEPPEPTELNVYKMSLEERRSLGIISLPESLSEALRELENSELMRQALLPTAFKNFLEIKWKEWDEYRIQVSGWELERYLEKL